MKTLFRITFAITLVVSFTLSAASQTIDTAILGTITDSSSAVEPGAILTPGVAVYNPDLHSSSTDGSAISANGGRVTWGQVNVDGITMVNNRHNYVNLYPSVDAIQEFKVQTGNYAAQYGGNAGSNVNIQIKSGTNEFHGDVFEFICNDAVDTRNYFIPPPTPNNAFNQHQFVTHFPA